MFAESLRRNLATVQLNLSDAQITQLEEHFLLLRRWNKVLNLTRIEDLEEVVQRHYCESLFLGMHLPENPLKIVDIGAGAGFPGIPVAVLRPESHITLVESHQRKSVFLREATRPLGNTSVLARRAEMVTQKFDWVVSRAVNYTEIHTLLRRLAPNVSLLASNASYDDRSTWNKIKVPWGDRRFLWLQSST